MAFPSQERYLSNIPDIRSAADKVSAAAIKLKAAKEQFNRASTKDANFKAVTDALKVADAEAKDAQANLKKVREDAIAQYKKELAAYNAKEKGKEQTQQAAQTSRNLESLRAQRDKLVAAQLPTAEVDAQIAALYEPYKPTKATGPTGPANVTGPTSPTEPTTPAQISLEDFLKNINDNPNTINQIKSYLGITKLDGVLDYETISRIYSKEKEIETLAGIRGPIDRITYYAQTRSTGGGVVPTINISSSTEAAGIINQAYQKLLGRYATAEEIKSLTPELNKAERANPSKTVNGVTTGGIDRNQFLTDLILATPEYKKRTESAQGSIRSDLANTAIANGLDLDKNFGDSVNSWIKRIESGEKAEVFKQLIRNTAKLGLPEKVSTLLDQGIDLETIYAPYKKAMAAVLEINPATISLSDATLRNAIGPDKEMSIYDFQKTLRKDPRWQYTNNAREEVSSITQKILQDFGFMG